MFFFLPTDSVKEVEEYMLSNEYVQFEHMMTISAKKKINTSKLKDKLREYLDYYSEQRRLLEMEDTMASRDDVNNFRSSLMISITEHKHRKLI